MLATETIPAEHAPRPSRQAMSAKVLTARATYKAMPDSEVSRLLLRLVDSGAMSDFLRAAGLSTAAERASWPVPTSAQFDAAHRDAELRRQHAERMRAIESTYRLSREDRDENAGQASLLSAVEPEEEEDPERFDGLGKAVRR